MIVVVFGLHVAGLALLAGGMQPAAQPLAMLQVALIQDQPAAGPSAPSAAQPVQRLPRPTPPARKARPVQQLPLPAPAVEQTAPGTSMNMSSSAAGDTPATTAAAMNTSAVTPASTTGARASAVSAARFDADYLNNPAPAYPALSRRLGEAGEVMLKVLVSATGVPARIELVRSAGSARLDRAARDAVAHWRFIPARQGELDIEDWVLVPIHFRLQDN